MGHLPSSTILLSLLLFLFSVLSVSSLSQAQIQSRELSYRRSLASVDKEGNLSLQSPPKKKTTIENKNQTKLLKPIKPKKINSTTTTSLSKTHLNKTLTSTAKTPKSSNSTKLLKPIKLTKLNSTSSSKTNLKSLSTTSNPTKPLKKSTDLPLPKNKTQPNPKPKSQQPTKPTAVKKPKAQTMPEPIIPWLDGDDLISEFRDLPSKFHQAFLPDLEKISTTSKAYLSKANKEITKGVQPIVGNKYAPTVASVTSCVFLILPLLLVIALFHQLRTYLSLQKILLFIQMYLAIYFGILSLTAVVTGLEPLRFFYASSPGSYVYTQVLQTLGYVLFLLVQLMNLLVVFSTAEGGLGSKAMGLAQMIVGLAVGLHYYAAVFHRAVLGEPPRTNWKIHGVYATCFLVICAFARAERRKKAYLQDGCEDGKKS